MMPTTADELLPLIAAGAQVVVRDEEWLVRKVEHTPADGLLVRCIGSSTLVRDTEATFFTNLDSIEPMRPSETRLVADDSPNFRRSRLYLEAMIRKTPVPATETGLAVAQHQLLDHLEYQRRAVHKSLTGLRPRLLIADAVGLGKTLEVGMILSELIRRGRGDKILVVTPRHILEQFQHELWTRFAIPLVRLDSEGIQRVRRSIPANRNPFTYYRRSIISIDTLKNAGRYRHHLEGIRWDAVVIDECHNLVNRGTLNNQLARVLAPRTEALLLTSATPHNGDPDSFAELIRLLDPTAVTDPEHITKADIEHLYVRRHKGHDEVAPELGDEWADRLEPTPILVEPSPPENALYDELADRWTHPADGNAPVSGKGRSLFPWTLFKAALSSHHALAQTVEARRKNLARIVDETGGLDIDQQREDEALESLAQRCETIDDNTASKLQRLVAELKAIGVGARSKTRVVVFSERIATLDWLAATLPDELGLKANDHIRVLHGGLADVKQMDVIEEFGLEQSKVRVLLTGDMASEGVNLHRQCNHLIHFDLPWSLITIEQRNGRIDRYGQTEPPDIRALLAVPDHPTLTGDARILTRLLEREDHAHRAFGESGSLLGLHSAELEEDSITKALRDRADVDEVVPEQPTNEFDLMALLSGDTGSDTAPLHETPSLFADDRAFVDEAMRGALSAQVYDNLDIRTDPDDPTFIELTPPADLRMRFSVLPHTYLREQKIVERLRLTADANVAERQLAKALGDSSSQWPDVGHLSPLHPFTQWLVDKALVSVGRNEAPVLVADVAAPVYCIQGLYSNGHGQPQLVEWLAVSANHLDGGLIVGDLFGVLDRAGVNPSMPNPGGEIYTTRLAERLGEVIDTARAELDERKRRHEQHLDELLAAPTERLDAWVRERHRIAAGLDEKTRRQRDTETGAVRDDTRDYIESMRSKGEPLVRVLAVLVGSDS